MPIRYEIDATRSLTTIAMTGDVTTADTTARFAVVVDDLLVVGMTDMILAQAGLMDRFETFSTEEEARWWIQNSH